MIEVYRPTRDGQEPVDYDRENVEVFYYQPTSASRPASFLPLWDEDYTYLLCHRQKGDPRPWRADFGPVEFDTANREIWQVVGDRVVRVKTAAAPGVFVSRTLVDNDGWRYDRPASLPQGHEAQACLISTGEWKVVRNPEDLLTHYLWRYRKKPVDPCAEYVAQIFEARSMPATAYRVRAGGFPEVVAKMREIINEAV